VVGNFNNDTSPSCLLTTNPKNRTRPMWFPQRASYCRRSVLRKRGGVAFPQERRFLLLCSALKCGSYITSIVLAVTGSWTRAQNVNKLWSNTEDTNDGNKGRDRSNEVRFIRNGLSNCDNQTLAAFTDRKKRSLRLLLAIGLLIFQQVLLRDGNENSMMGCLYGCSFLSTM